MEPAEIALRDAVECSASSLGFFAKKSDDFGWFGDRLFGIGIFPAAIGIPFRVAFGEIIADDAVAEILPLLLAHRSTASRNIPAEIEICSLVACAGGKGQTTSDRPFLKSFGVCHCLG